MSEAASGHVEVVKFDTAVFDLDTVKRAVHRFTASFSAEINQDSARIVCALSFRPNTSPQAAKAAIDELRTEVLDQDLRRRIALETAPVRNAILALAFSNPKLQGDE